MHSELNTLSEYTYFTYQKTITSYTFLLVFKIVESLQCILKDSFRFRDVSKMNTVVSYEPYFHNAVVENS